MRDISHMRGEWTPECSRYQLDCAVRIRFVRWPVSESASSSAYEINRGRTKTDTATSSSLGEWHSPRAPRGLRVVQFGPSPGVRRAAPRFRASGGRYRAGPWQALNRAVREPGSRRRANSRRLQGRKELRLNQIEPASIVRGIEVERRGIDSNHRPRITRRVVGPQLDLDLERDGRARA